MTDASGLQYRDVVVSPTNMVAAAKRGDLNKVKELVAQEAQAQAQAEGQGQEQEQEQGGKRSIVNALGMWSTTPLMTAVQYGHIDVAEYLLAQPGVDVKHVNEKGATALLFACAEGHAAIARKLLALGATATPPPVLSFYNAAVDKSGPATPLTVACTNGHTGCVEALADAGASVSHLSDIDLPFRTGQPRKMAPLHITALHRRLPAFKALLACGADCGRLDGDGASLLTYAALAGPQVHILRTSLSTPLSSLLYAPIYLGSYLRPYLPRSPCRPGGTKFIPSSRGGLPKLLLCTCRMKPNPCLTHPTRARDGSPRNSFRC